MIKRCGKCGACWVQEGDRWQHYWGNGNRGTNPGNKSELDLAALVCRPYGDEQCINPARQSPGGQTWQDRAGFLAVAAVELEMQLKQPKT